MYPDVTARFNDYGICVPASGTIHLYHAGPNERLDRAISTGFVPGSPDDGDPRRINRVYLASSPEIQNVVPHAEGVVEVEIDVNTPLELGMGDSSDKAWVELVYEVPSGEDGLRVLSVCRV